MSWARAAYRPSCMCGGFIYTDWVSALPLVPFPHYSKSYRAWYHTAPFAPFEMGGPTHHALHSSHSPWYTVNGSGVTSTFVGKGSRVAAMTWL